MYCVYTQLFAQQKLGNMDGSAVGEQTGNVNDPAPCKHPVQSQPAYWDEKILALGAKVSLREGTVIVIIASYPITAVFFFVNRATHSFKRFILISVSSFDQSITLIA